MFEHKYNFSQVQCKFPDDGRRPKHVGATETCRSDIYVYFNVNFKVLFKLIEMHLLVSELFIYQNARCNNKKKK